MKNDSPQLSLNLTLSEEWETSRYQAESRDEGQTGAGWRLLEHGGRITFGHFSTEILSFEKDDATISAGHGSEVHLADLHFESTS